MATIAIDQLSVMMAIQPEIIQCFAKVTKFEVTYLQHSDLYAITVIGTLREGYAGIYFEKFGLEPAEGSKIFRIAADAVHQTLARRIA